MRYRFEILSKPAKHPPLILENVANTDTVEESSRTDVAALNGSLGGPEA